MIYDFFTNLNQKQTKAMQKLIPDLSNITLSWNNFERRMAQILSIVFQPMLMPLITAWLLFNSHTYIDILSTPALRKFVYATLLLTMVILPVLIFGYLFQKKIITTYHIDKREERKYAFMVTIIFMILTYWIFSRVALPSIFYAMWSLKFKLVIVLSRISPLRDRSIKHPRPCYIKGVSLGDYRGTA